MSLAQKELAEHLTQALWRWKRAGRTQDERYPRITLAEWQARERPRQLLENILTRQVEICEAQRFAILKDSLAGPSPYERAAEIALAYPDAARMQITEESNFRQIWRITNLLLKIKRLADEEGSGKARTITRDVYKRKTSYRKTTGISLAQLKNQVIENEAFRQTT